MKYFDRWDAQGVEVQDPGLKRYVSIEPRFVPRSGGRSAKQMFYKSHYTIVERLVNKLMTPGHRGKKHMTTSGHCGGKSLTALRIVEDAFSIIEKKTNKNPVGILVKAIENAAPRDDITTIEYGGARYPQAVDCSPLRRIDVALRMFVQGSYQKSFGKKIKMADALADELVFASQLDQKSTAISKKLELERQADSAR